VTVTDGRGLAVRDGGLGTWLAKAAPARARGTVTVALVSDTVMRRLNHQFRKADYATDVLSFPCKNDSGSDFPRVQSRKSLPESFLGDIVIATGVARRQARGAGHSEATERRVLALHGLLHLLGYDHEGDDGLMRRVEDRLRKKAGLPAGLIARARAPRARA
jgi:probable rRNA maturation factor